MLRSTQSKQIRRTKKQSHKSSIESKSQQCHFRSIKTKSLHSQSFTSSLTTTLSNFSTKATLPPPLPYSAEEVELGRQPVKLNYRFQKASQPSNCPPLIILHGLLGHANNWTNIAGRSEFSDHDVYSVDLRDHGQSPHTNYIDYIAMANDIAALITELSPSGATVIGHSMGGKAAGATALLHSHLVSGLVLVDILPVNYDREMQEINNILESVANVDFSSQAGRKEIDTQLAEHIADSGIRQWLLTNITSQPQDLVTGATNRWKPNISTIRRSYHNIRQFDLSPSHIWPYHHPTALIIGGRSSFADRNRAIDIMRDNFPETQLSVIEGAGHWVHAEKPKEFTASLSAFLKANSL